MTDDWKTRLTRSSSRSSRSRPAAADQRVPRHAVRDLPLPPRGRVRVRKEVTLLGTRLEQAGKRVTRISLAECMTAALEAKGLDAAALAAGREVSRARRRRSRRSTRCSPSTRRSTTSSPQRMPDDADPLRDIVFILRAGALFPVYRTFSLLEQLKGRVHVPTVLFYPGDLDGAAGLRFMGVLDAEHNYRPKIF